MLPLAFLRRAMGTWAMGARQRPARYLVANLSGYPLANMNFQLIMRPKPRKVSAAPIYQPSRRFPTHTVPALAKSIPILRCSARVISCFKRP